MRSPLHEAIIKTLVYASVFDYPLTEKELFHRLIEVASNQSAVGRALKKIKQIEENDGYYFFNGKRALVALRKKRIESSKKKKHIAQRAAIILRHIPTLKLIGISGGVASENADEGDDIDFFLITAGGQAWITRLLVTVLLEVFGLRRRPSNRKVKDKICVNMIIDENRLSLPREEQDLFGAYEVALMKPLWQRENTHERFLSANQWVEKWLPNWESMSLRGTKQSRWTRKNQTGSPPRANFEEICSGRDDSLYPPSSFVERIIRGIQLRYMNKRHTTEIIEDGRIRFHPHNARERVMEEYRKKLRGIRGF